MDIRGEFFIVVQFESIYIYGITTNGEALNEINFVEKLINGTYSTMGYSSQSAVGKLTDD